MVRLCNSLKFSIGKTYVTNVVKKLKTRMASTFAAALVIFILVVLMTSAVLKHHYRTTISSDHPTVSFESQVFPNFQSDHETLIRLNQEKNRFEGRRVNSSLVKTVMSVQNENLWLRDIHVLASSYASPVKTAHLMVIPDEFHPAADNHERQIFYELLRALDDMCSSHKIPYFMNYGTLLGSIRHHDMTPWDDDADVAMPYADKSRVWNYLQDMIGSGYEVNITADTQFRFVGSKSRLYSPSWEWKWPYIDIDFYHENETHIWIYASGSILLYNKAIIFPLHRRPLGPLFLNAPMDGLRFIALTYNDCNGCSTGMQHKLGRNRPYKKIPCSVFNETYPFVHRSLTWDEKVMETLKIGSTSLYSLIVDEPKLTAGVNPFSLQTPAKLLV